MADSLFYEGQGMRLADRFEFVEIRKRIDTRSGEELATDFIRRHGLKFTQ